MIEKSLIEKESKAVPPQYVICCSLIANRMLGMEINGKPLTYEISHTVASCALTTTDGKKDRLSGYDFAVLEAVHTIWEYGREDHVITYGSVYRVMVHNRDFDTPSDHNLVKVRESLNKLKKTKLRLCLENEETVESLIRIGIADDTMCLLCEPALLKQCKDLRQIKTVPANLLAVQDKSGKAVQNREVFIDTRERLLRHVVMQSRMHKNEPLVTFDTIFGKAFKTLPAKQRAKLISYIKQILSYWKDMGFVVDFYFRKNGRTFDAIKLYFTSSDKDKKPKL